MENNVSNLDQQKLNEMLTVSAAPHVKTDKTTQKIMLDVIIALMPALVAAVYFFGLRALWLVIASVIAAVVSELAFQKAVKKPVTISDLSAVVTGILVAYNVPVSLPFPMVILGSVFAIIVVKQLFGGIGYNFMNPALAARAFIMASWPQAMGSYPAPFSTDMVASATPLQGGTMPSLMDAFIGTMGGCIGEVSALAILIGAAYLVFKGVINLRIPLAYIITAAVMFIITGTAIDQVALQLLIGGIMLGAFFMATDYSSTPVSAKGELVFGIGCGILTVLIRVFGPMPEGVSYSILLMNVATPFIERITKPKVYGVEVQKNERNH